MGDTLGAIKTAYDLTKDLLEVRDATAQARKIGELQHQILAAQESALAANEERATLVKKIGGLETEIAGFKTWEKEKQRYQLTKLPPGVFVLVLKSEMADGEPEHYLCETCYQRGQKSILHVVDRTLGQELLQCNACGAKLKTGERQRIDINRGPRNRSWT